MDAIARLCDRGLHLSLLERPSPAVGAPRRGFLGPPPVVLRVPHQHLCPALQAAGAVVTVCAGCEAHWAGLVSGHNETVISPRLRRSRPLQLQMCTPYLLAACCSICHFCKPQMHVSVPLSGTGNAGRAFPPPRCLFKWKSIQCPRPPTMHVDAPPPARADDARPATTAARACTGSPPRSWDVP